MAMVPRWCLRRDRIGQFGIGKFATLAACERFEVLTRCGAFSASVLFDRREWERGEGEWHLPMELDPRATRGAAAKGPAGRAAGM